MGMIGIKSIIRSHIFARQYLDCAGVSVSLITSNFSYLAGKPIEAKCLFFMACRYRLTLYLYCSVNIGQSGNCRSVFWFGPFGLIIRFLRATCAIAFMRMRTTIYSAVTVLVLLMHALMVSVAVAVTVFILMLMVSPHGVKGGCSSNNYRTTRLPCSGSVVETFCPALKFITLTSWCLTRNRKGMAIFILAGCRIGLCSWCAGAAVCIIVQRKSLQGWRTLEIVISRVLAVCKQGGCSL